MSALGWLVLLAIALSLIVLGKWIASKDEVYALAVYSASLLTALWGLAIAPILVSITLGILTMGWLQVISLKHQARF